MDSNGQTQLANPGCDATNSFGLGRDRKSVTSSGGRIGEYRAYHRATYTIEWKVTAGRSVDSPSRQPKEIEMTDVLKIFVTGVITIGVITALFLPGRQTVAGIKAGGTAASGLLGTAIKG